MRIGIVTQPLEMNYGGILQNWALQQVLKTLGHTPITIDAYQRYSTPHFVASWTKAFLLRLTGKNIKLPKRYNGSLRGQLMGQFIERHIDKTRVMWNYRPGIINRYKLDAIIVGSDQVWRADYNRKHLEDMYLRFAAAAPIRKRVAYAASFGVDNWDYSPELTARCAALARQMDAISVREQSGVALCHDHLGVEAQCVLDPTLLLEAGQYSSIIDKNWTADEPYLAVYCLDLTHEKEDLFNRIAAQHGLTVRHFSCGWNARLTVEQWLAMLSNASMVVTDSFHGTVFSILFHRDFYTLCNPKRGNSRMTGLMDMLGLTSRLIPDQAPAMPGASDIDWTDVDTRLRKHRNHSIAFLKESLKD